MIGHQIAMAGALSGSLPDPAAIFGAALTSWYQPGNWTLSSGEVTSWACSAGGDPLTSVGADPVIPGAINGAAALESVGSTWSSTQMAQPSASWGSPMYMAWVQTAADGNAQRVRINGTTFGVGSNGVRCNYRLPGMGALISDPLAGANETQIWEVGRTSSDEFVRLSHGPFSASEPADASSGSATLQIYGSCLYGDIIICRGHEATSQQREQVRAWLSKKYAL